MTHLLGSVTHVGRSHLSPLSVQGNGKSDWFVYMIIVSPSGPTYWKVNVLRLTADEHRMHFVFVT